jgi:serine/threonine protein kinase
MIGTKFAHYEITSHLGSGGMGQVYAATDSKLGRSVAIKVLPATLASDPERLSRFRREAQVLASLNHPNIAQIYGIEESGEMRCIVMERVEGQTLQEILKKGPMPLDDALTIAGQIAQALAAAHDKGIVHRDLKPGNVMLTAEGVVKVLDFGLAKATEAVELSPMLSNSPTMIGMATNAGVILGTAAYMSPEQARGKHVDRRADIWAFGVVLYELLTGRQPFQGDDVTETLAAIVKDQPSLDTIPHKVRRLLKACLEKDPQRRPQAVADWPHLLDEASSRVRSTSRPALLGWVLAGVMTLALGIFTWETSRTLAPAANLVRFELPRRQDAVRPFTEFAISPDGRYLVYFAPEGGPAGTVKLWLTPLDSPRDSRTLPGTELPFNASPNYPFWSHDSRFVVFASGGKLRKIDVAGGSPQAICDFPDEDAALTSGTWNADGVILFGKGQAGGGIQRTLAGDASSTCSSLFTATGNFSYDFPSFLPDGRHFLYSSNTLKGPGVFVGSLDGKGPQDSKLLLPEVSTAVFAPSSDPDEGYVVFMRENALLARRLDTRRLELEGEETQLGEVSRVFGFPSFSASRNGLLVYSGATFRKIQPTWMDSSGNIVGKLGAPDIFIELALAPDGRRTAATVHSVQANGSNIWVLEPTGVTNPVTFDKTGWTQSPIWSPDSAQIAFASFRSGAALDLYRKQSSGAGEDELLYTSSENKRPTSWSRDGRYLLYAVSSRKSKTDLWVLPIEGAREPRAFLSTEFDERNGQFSPDTHWVAFESDESGSVEIVVRPFPDSSKGKVVVSKGGGRSPRWRDDGRELYYLSADGSVMAVEVAAGPVFQPGMTRRLFQVSDYADSLDVTAGGKKFLIGIPTADSVPTPFTVLMNWQTSLKK